MTAENLLVSNGVFGGCYVNGNLLWAHACGKRLFLGHGSDPRQGDPLYGADVYVTLRRA